MNEQTKPIEGLTAGRIVHYVMPNNVHRPAIIVNVHDAASGLVNARVFTDGANDYTAVGWHSEHPGWVTSIHFDDSPAPAISTWHFIERA